MCDDNQHVSVKLRSNFLKMWLREGKILPFKTHMYEKIIFNKEHDDPKIMYDKNMILLNVVSFF